MRLAATALLLFVSASALGAEPAPPPAAAFDPLACRWTFGNHEPISMYRRAGNRVTGGIEGSALWLDQWHHWFDSEASTRLMQELGLNTLHCRFYKGMGWQYEARDFPRVKQFVENCHRHGVRALAYVQFSTLYYETLLDEIPDLASWAAVDENGQKRTYHAGAYYRWLPCVTAPGFEPYLKKVIRIALVDGDFDGIMFDNCHVPPCYCARCARLFREYLAREPKPEQRFGLPSVKHVLPPARKPEYGEIQDPIYQQWVLFRCERVTELYRRLYQYIKQCKPTALVTGNIQAIRRANMAGAAALNMADLAPAFDIFVSQSGNVPGVVGGCVVNRVREMKLAQALRRPILALCDGDAGISADAESQCVLTLMEDAVFGGIPTDRTVMKADRQMVSPELLAFRRPLLRRFNDTVRTGHDGLAAPSCQPVRVLYSRESLLFSELSHRAVLGTEEILLRNHVPYGLLPTAAGTPLEIPVDCAVLVVPDQRCLSEAEIAALVQFAQRGGRLIVTGASGTHDAWYRERRDNPLCDGLKGVDPRRVICRAEVDQAPIKGAAWTTKVAAPVDGGRRLLADLDRLWTPPLRIEAPATVFAEVKHDVRSFYVHLVNYAGTPVAAGTRIELRGKGLNSARCTWAAPMENRPAAPLPLKAAGPDRWTLDVPGFTAYAVVSVAAAQ